MKAFILDLLSETGNVSTGRLMSIISLFIGGSIAYVGLYRNCDLSGSAPVIGIFVASAFGGHVAAKYAEKETK